MVAVALHTFQDHNRVVNQHPDSQSQPAQRHDVETYVRAEHQEKGRYYRKRDREADDGGAFEVAEEEEEHDDGEDAAEDGGVEHLVNGLLDKGRLVEDDFHTAVLEQGGILGEKFVQALLDRGADLDGVGVAFLEDRDLDAFAAVDAGDEVALAVAAKDATHVLELDRRAVDLTDDDFADLVDALELVEGADEELGLAVLEHPAG